jgi:hypothetical protein
MALENFCKTIKPPNQPIENGGIEEWNGVEQALKTKLPSDYKNYVNNFGTGCISNFIWVFNPFSKNSNLNLHAQIKAQLDAIATLENEFNEIYPYSIHPKSGRLLPWGITDNGDVMFWLTDGEPDSWKTVIHESRGTRYETFDATITNFLMDLNLGRITSKIIPIELLDRNLGFKSVAA